jgi:hypothetical protein
MEIIKIGIVLRQNLMMRVEKIKKKTNQLLEN